MIHALLLLASSAAASPALDELSAFQEGLGAVSQVSAQAPEGVVVQAAPRKTENPPGWPAELAMTPITPAELEDLFAFVRDRRELNWGFMLGGCYARAYLIAHELETRFGVVSIRAEAGPPKKGAKITVMALGRGAVQWTYHTVPVVLVATAQGYKLYALDPALSIVPLTYEDWRARLEANSKNVKHDLHSRFVYQDSKQRKAWDPKSLEHARMVLDDPARYLGISARD